MFVGIPREILPGENRVAALPDTIRKLVQAGYAVGVEAGAGQGVFVSDDEYRNAGAEVIDGPVSLLQRADVVLKVKQPYRNGVIGEHEAALLKPGSVLITFLHPAAPSNHDMIRTLAERRVTSFTMDGIPRTSRAQAMDALTSMSTVTGYKSVLMAASALPKFVPMIGTAIGVVKPATFLVVGAGVVGLQSIATAKRLGAVVKCIDIRAEAREAAASLGATVEGFEVPDGLALAAGGYARALPEEWLEKEREALGPLLTQADAVILSALVPGEVAPILMTASMVESMAPGSAIVDVAVDQGGNCALTKPGEVYDHGQVHIIGVQNIPG
ncbi:MAG: NAD(P)(+) transhydrogenase (Re/Si-specific) subunit alpha, partial [Thermoleophilia bacterium]|nr:NAD(P)(+) transhydrogenase (Re/Si-specific) subunit alpha [Thermoleophilia bacterium]